MKKDIKTKQYTTVTYMGCVVDNTLPGESMAIKTVGNIRGRQIFPCRKQSSLTPTFRGLLCTALSQSHFDYACTTWCANLNNKVLKKIQIIQNKCIRICLNVGNRAGIGVEMSRGCHK